MSFRSPLLVAATALLLAVPTTAFAAAEPPPGAGHGRLSSTVRARSLEATAKVDVMVQLTGDPVAVAEAKAQRSFTRAERAAAKQKLRQSQERVSAEIEASGGEVVTTLQSAYNGVRARLSRTAAAELAERPDVAGVHAITSKTIANSVSVPFLGVPQVWQDTGYTGAGVKVAIIDTGIDYTHADFGGPGTVEAFEAAAATSDQPAAADLFGPAAARVKGGHDFVGDAYDADAEPGTAAATPQPDANPLDCHGHGTHVAGTAGGSGVTVSGTTYAGPYDSNTAAEDFKVGPGVAPQVDLYALRVFGCQGSTDVVVEAIDWAVEHDMDVINLSLGGTFGRADDPDAVAASNAAAAGIVVVASAGNEGRNPYVVGAPASGDGVVSVAAVDAIPSFPGAELSFGGQRLEAINANDAGLPETELTLVNVGDDPDTPVVESLGCSVAAFTAAGIEPGKGQLAVVQRGDCARAAKAIYGEQAGAAAVLMVSDEDALPPFEDQITSNSDTQEPFVVTIPFLGVPSSAGEILAAAEGSGVTLAAKTLANPAQGVVASFSSSGPVNGSSEVGVSLAAPGVSIASAGVGTGSGALVESGTSMAAPQVAGVAALSVQAHPGWRGLEVAAGVVSTADPIGSALTVGGTGLVDPAAAVATQSYLTGDGFRAASGAQGAEVSLNFGFVEPSDSFRGTRHLTIHNRGSKAVSYRLAVSASAASRPANVILGATRVKVPARSKVKVPVTLRVKATALGSSLAEDQFGFREVSGVITATAAGSSLRVPYLLVPRAKAQVSATLTGTFPDTMALAAAPEAAGAATGESEAAPAAGPGAAAAESIPAGIETEAAEPAVPDATSTVAATETEASPVEPEAGADTVQAAEAAVAPEAAAEPEPVVEPAAEEVVEPEVEAEPEPAPSVPLVGSVQLRNRQGAVDAMADFYTWGLADAGGDQYGSWGAGYDLRAAGVQSYDTGAGKLLLFAVNNHDRWSTAATQEFDVAIDSDGDGAPEFVVFSYDSGYLRNGSYNGLTEVFYQDAATGDLYATGYNAIAPTDSSTILLPVNAADLGLTEGSGAFSYTVAAYSVEDALAFDGFDGWAGYDPWAKAIEDSAYLNVPRNRSVTVPVVVNPDALVAQRPLGVMVVVFDNAAGSAEARLLKV